MHNQIRVHRKGERGIALITAVLLLVVMTGLAAASLTASGVDLAASRANLGSFSRTYCQEEVGRFIIEQLPRENVIGVWDGINYGTCASAGIATVNMDSLGGGCNTASMILQCVPNSPQTNLKYPNCPNTRAVATVAPTPYNPGGSLVGEDVGKSNDSRRRMIAVRVFTAEIPECEPRYLANFLDIAAMDSYFVGTRGDLAQ